MRASQHPALHACPGLVLTCSPACTRPSTLIELVGRSARIVVGGAVMQVADLTVLDRAEHHAFAVRRPSWIGLRPGIRRKPAQHAPIDVEKTRCPCSPLPFGGQPLAGHPVKAQVRSNFRCRQRRRHPPPCRIDQTIRTDAALLQHQNSEAFIRRSEANARTLTDRHALFHLL